ncbi:cbb3-type cytochrome oxidase assembly protein CcoS [Devosia aquimaris]|uniref:cbb3-type cytochrome oxidase assembly protein CcoS n=1 Tax=Devosia aquimaris TaxID=2866214 RepID=UPI001CD079A6|nr:cbb3-type cytochrome oxidase assembly protein CcoS [Devosia sp. CJK-A8-3]
MSGLLILIPCAIGLGALALLAFFWALRSGQYDDLEGDGQRVLLNDEPLENIDRGQGRGGN